MRATYVFAIALAVLCFSTGLGLIAEADSSFPKEQLISLITKGADSITAGNTEAALDQLVEAKSILASQIAALSSGEREVVLNNLSFSILRADGRAKYNSIGKYYKFNVYLQISNLSNEVVNVGSKTIQEIEVSGFAISPEGKQLEDHFLFDFDYLLPGVDKDVPVGFVIGLSTDEEFVPGDYTIMIRLGPSTGEAKFMKEQSTILKGD